MKAILHYAKYDLGFEDIPKFEFNDYWEMSEYQLSNSNP